MAEFVSVTEVAEALGSSPSSIRAAIRSGNAPFPFERVGSRYRIPAEFVDAVGESSKWAVVGLQHVLFRVRQKETPYVDRWVALVCLDDPVLASDLRRLAEIGSRLTRDAESPDHGVWNLVEDSILDAWIAVGLPRPSSARLAAALRDPPALEANIQPVGSTGAAAGMAGHQDWVSKTDILRYARCPYSFWLLDSGEISFEEMVDDFQRHLMVEGNEFQRAVESRALRLHVEANELPSIAAKDTVLLDARGFRNEELRIFGEPDGIDVASGELLPIEIKSHHDVRRTDELELAFYWLLLEPYRTVKPANPRGFLIVRREGRPKKIEVAIRPQRFDEVRQLLQEVRHARRDGVRARICGCLVCSQLRRTEVLRLTWNRKDLTLIFGIGRNYAVALEEMGILDYEALRLSEPDVVVSGLRARGYFVSTNMVESWRRHADAWASQAPVYFGKSPFLESDSFIALDLEYDTNGLIWLLGACVVRGDDREYVTLWADNRSEEKRNLVRFAALLNLNEQLPVVTWNGDGADIPRIRHEAVHSGLGALVTELDLRHRDLFQYAVRSLRLPITSLSLKDIAEYHGVRKLSIVRDGMEADTLYRLYRAERDPEMKGRRREALVDYNRDDLEALIAVTQEVRSLSH